MSYSKRNNFIKKFHKKLQSLKLVPGFFVFSKSWTQPLLENQIFKTPNYIRYVIAKLSKLVQISMLVSPGSFLQRVSLKIQKKRHKTSFKANFLWNFLYFFKKCYINWPNVITRLCLVPSSSVRCVLCFMLGHLMMSLYLNIWKVKILFYQILLVNILLSKRAFKLTKKHFPCFTSARF